MGLWCWKGLTGEAWHAVFEVAGNAAAPALLLGAWEDSRTHHDPQRGESTGIGVKGSEPIGDSFGELVKGPVFSASMAADLAVIEDQ